MVNNCSINITFKSCTFSPQANAFMSRHFNHHKQCVCTSALPS